MIEQFKELKRKINQLWVENKGDTEEANQLRLQVDEIWKQLTKEEKRKLF